MNDLIADHQPNRQVAILDQHAQALRRPDQTWEPVKTREPREPGYWKINLSITAIAVGYIGGFGVAVHQRIYDDWVMGPYSLIAHSGDWLFAAFLVFTAVLMTGVIWGAWHDGAGERRPTIKTVVDPRVGGPVIPLQPGQRSIDPSRESIN